MARPQPERQELVSRAAPRAPAQKPGSEVVAGRSLTGSARRCRGGKRRAAQHVAAPSVRYKVVAKHVLQCGALKGKTLRNKTTTSPLKTKKYDSNDVLSPVRWAVNSTRSASSL